MWTYNSGSSLERSLPSIERAIDESSICHRIAVDGGSVDKTVPILAKYGWRVKVARTKGIPHQANEALNMVDTPVFAAFEHDILLNPSWFRRTSAIMDKDEKAAAVQGVRLYRGSKSMAAIEDWMYRAGWIPTWSFSIDNTLFRTEVVKRAGGFPSEDAASADTILRKNIFRTGYRWITDSKLISGHYRKSFPQQLRHQIKTLELAKYSWSSTQRTASIPRHVISLLGGNPVNVLRMSRQSRMLRVPLAWYILRLQRGFYLAIPHENKGTRPVPMDSWHLARFIDAVVQSRSTIQKPSSHCAWCGKITGFAYSFPRNWGNVVPILQGGTSRTFWACSDEHAGDVASVFFKNSFDYVEANQSETGTADDSIANDLAAEHS